MGIVNVTPDSFSDGGQHATTAAAVAHGRLLASQGAGIIDVGGESTRPGAARVPESEELERVVPVVAALAADGITCSVDTMRVTVAEAAVAAGDAGARSTRDLVAKLGRARPLGQKSVGTPDPGAVSLVKVAAVVVERI